MDYSSLILTLLSVRRYFTHVIFHANPIEAGRGDPKATAKYFELVLWVVRVVTCCMLSKGPQNEQVLKLGRRFLEENRNLVVNVFKRNASIGGPKPEEAGGDLKELADTFVLLISLTGYIEV